MAQQITKIEKHVSHGGKIERLNFNKMLEKNDVIRTVTIRSGSIVDGIGFEILNQSNGKLLTSFHGGNGGEPTKIHLSEGERITQISGIEGESIWCPKRRLILQITIHTNYKPQGYGPYGKEQDWLNTKPFKVHDPIDGSVIGVFGLSDTYLESIGVTVSKMVETPQEVTTEKYGPYGRVDNAQNFNEIIEKTDVIKTVNIRSGCIVDGIGFEILNQNGKMRTPFYGGNGGNSHKICLKEGEHITQISGYEGNFQWCPSQRVILQIKVHTNFKPEGYGPYGAMQTQNCSNTKPFKAHDPIVGSINGFFGFSETYLESIGVSVSKGNNNKCGC